MVGVAGRSKGCRTCRRRRVKCDERHPQCERCEKGNYDCEGYQRQRVFVDEVARTIRLTQRTRPRTLEDREITPQSQGIRETVPAGMGLSAFQHNVYVSFLISRLFSGGPRIVSWNWMLSQAEDAKSAPAQDSLRALSTVYFGRMHRQQEVMSEGHVLYGKALKSLNKSLQDAETAWCLSVLTSAMTLQLYEFIAFSSAGGWLQHAGGVGKLIELRGPRRHQTPHERHLLEVNRMTIILGHLVKRKRCFLESHDWISTPWALEPESKTPLLRLHDLLCAIPGLLEDATHLQQPNLAMNELIASHQSLSRKILDQLVSLYEWRAVWEEKYPDVTHEFTPFDPKFAPTLALDVDVVFPTLIHFSNLTRANEITLYNATLLLLLKLGSEVIGSSFDPMAAAAQIPRSITNRALHFPGEARNAQEVATEICKSVDFHLLDHQSSAGAFFLLFPLRLAYQAFVPESREASWLGVVLGHIAELSGFEISRKLSASGRIE